MKGLGISDSNTIFIVWDDTLGLEDLVPIVKPRRDNNQASNSQLGASTVKHDWVETKSVQERKGQSKVIKLVGEDSTSNPGISH